ncbi:MAG: isoleucine--tRNA ligase [Bdellovibrionales bacterium]|nr:isoleucine--tRNA ligase [Bdellovibrionales bacterium]
MSFEPVKPEVNFPKLEEKQIAFWDQNKIFEKSIRDTSALVGGGDSAHSKAFSFYDGPPFATGLPHYGHLLAGTLKDIVPRYWTMKGYSVKRRFGWDCHGIPVEFEINKTLNLHSRVDILEYGVDKYNAACRGIVDRYSTEWKKTVKRMGRWVDMDNAYFTMQVEFMQSVWWVFKQLFDKGLIYEGMKVVPYSTGISTPLSNFEANLDYREVQDPAVTVTFPLVAASSTKLGVPADTAIVAWTTTPWTLPSNLGLAVGREISYALVKEKSSGKHLIFADARLAAYSKKPLEDFETLKTFKGAELVGLEYTEILPYFASKRAEGAFKVIHSDHVTTDSGTGIVHMAPAFGEEDFFAMKANHMPVVNPVDDDGVFTTEVSDFKGMKVKDADKEIIARLKKDGRLYKQDTLVHSYPFCYRSGTPLIYRAVPSWFVAVEKIKDQMVTANKSTHWIPETLRDGRFGNWLENARDWAISRNRFWGTPLPIWKSKDGKLLCVGSRDELEKLSGQKVNDLHKESVDIIVINKDGIEYRRIDSVLDCWFESGSMPYAQWGYPFKHEKEFADNFPADFIAEGLDQTRGWFYTLMVIGTALFGKAPFKNVVVNGMILAEDGKKMSKSLKNYPDPSAVINEHGADAIRLYMIDSPAVKAEELRFAERGVREIVRRILLRWWNAYSFFTSYGSIDKFQPKGDYVKSPNLLDQWILSKTHSLIKKTEEEMAAYRLYSVVPELLNFIESLTNTYIRFNRPHFWKEGMPEDKRYAYETLYYVLTSLSKIMAPFAPFLSEETYQNLSRALPPGTRKESVHLEGFPALNTALIKPELEAAVARMDALVMLGRNLREKIKIKAKIPLLSMKLIHRDQKALNELKKLEVYFQDELNIRKFEYVTDEDKYIQVKAKANFPVLGKKVGGKMKAIAAKIAQFSNADLEKLEAGQIMTIEGESVTIADVEIQRLAHGNNPNIAAHQLISFEVDPTLGEEQVLEGLSREVMRKIQQARKNADLKLDDRISLTLYLEGKLLDAAKAHEAVLKQETLTTKLEYVSSESAIKGTHTEIATDVEEGKIGVGITVLKTKTSS